MKLKSSPCRVAELVTTNQSEPTITNWLQLIRYREKQIYGYDKVTAPCMIVSDRSLPLLIASLMVFAGESLREFMERSWRIVSGRASETDLYGLIIHSGLSHFMKDCKDNCKKYYRKEHQWFGITFFRLLAAFNRLDEVRRLFYSICIVLRAEYQSPLCRFHLERIFDENKKYFPAEHHNVEHVQDSSSAEEDTTDPDPRKYTTELTEEDALLQQASSFKELVMDLDVKAKRSLRQENV
ncbi:hypothetical protein HOLleu_03735 [Holothuria leucospilota]|uniref:Uncharacterized protein n=1 Tax=Holothuria leucospilota TaxID=206669 RepID=A0A9Q1HLZ3_HOLLE|nr:hypothetical protein HOLleu_03735 [Holothuria leucospilota]